MTSQRKLSCILAADAAGYSRLMGDDEKATERTLTEYRQVFTQHIVQHQGRMVDTAGDSVLAVFDSPVEAVECAADIQRELTRRNRQLAEHRRMQFRIGLNLGDVITHEDGTIYGDGVNIAARLQSLAEPGGICVSANVFEQVDGHLPLKFADIGQHQAKNIAKPIKAYKLLLQPDASAHPFGSRLERPLPKLVGIGLALTLVAAVAVGIWMWRDLRHAGEIATPRDMQDKPSIAVLPFANLSGDSTQDYFAEGISEDIITTLAKIRNLFVIARNSTFQYKGKPTDVRQLSRELGARFVLEGSVRKEGNQVRVTAQLIDSTTGTHLWAQRYERPLKDIFSVQEEITRHIVSALDVEIVEGEQARLWRKSTENLEAYELMMRGRGYLILTDREDLALARQYLTKAIEIDPKFAMGYTSLASYYLLQVIFAFSESPSADLARAADLQTRAIELDDSQGYSYAQLGRIYMQKRQLDEALVYGKKAVELEPSGGESNAIYAHILEASGKPAEALNYINKALRLQPFPNPWYPWLQGNCLRQLGRYEEAIAAQQRAIALSPKFLWPRVFLVDAYVAAGRGEEAQAKAKEVLQLEPSFTVDAFLGTFVWYRDSDVLKGYAANLRRAGLK